VVEMGVKVEVEIEQGVPWYALELALSVYSISRLVCLIFRLVDFERLRCLLMMA
jgi:hypothetical protein